MNLAKYQDTKLISRNQLHFYANIELTERETKKTILFTIATEMIKYQGINLSKDAKDLFSESYKTLKKETERDTNKWKHRGCSWTGRINIIIMSIYPKQSIKSKQFLSRFQ